VVAERFRILKVPNEGRPDSLIDVSMLFPSRSRQIHGPVPQIRTGCSKTMGLIIILIMETKSMSDKSVELNRLTWLSARDNVTEVAVKLSEHIG
jgi:hypothetical protein